MKRAVAFLAIACAALAQDRAMDILHRTAETYAKMGPADVKVTVETIRGDKMSAETATQPLAFDKIDQHVTHASIARQEQYMVDGKPRPIYVIRVSRDDWPRTQNAMYRIDRENFHVYKTILYKQGVTEISLYAEAAPAKQAGTLEGTEAPDFTLKDAAGAPVHLRDVRGKVVLVDFWATWCPPCRALMPRIQKMHEDWAAKGLVVLGLDVGEDAEQVTKFAKEQKYTFRLLLDAEPEVTSRYFVEAYPTTFVIGRDGKILFRELGGGNADGLVNAVRQALGAD